MIFNSLTPIKLFDQPSFVDLSSGYPDPYLTSSSMRNLLFSTYLRVVSNTENNKYKFLDEMSETFKVFLGIDNKLTFNVGFLQTASYALYNTLLSLLQIANRSRKQNVELFYTTPNFDVPISLAKKMSINLKPVSGSASFILPSTDVIIQELSKASSKSLPVLLLTSPNNPTGEIWSKHDFISLGEYCSEHNIIIVVDHCFLHSGTHQTSDVTTIWSLNIPNLKWVGVWDTGKVINLMGLKLSCVLSNDLLFFDHFEKLNKLLFYQQFSFQNLFFLELIKKEYFCQIISSLRSICLENERILDGLFGDLVVPNGTLGGSLRVLHFRGGNNISIYNNFQKSREVGFLDANLFNSKKGLPAVRISLSRNTEEFRNAMKQLLKT